MYILVPSWYSKDRNIWSQDFIPWYRNTFKINFDDTINQLKIFKKNGEQVGLLLLHYVPHLRHILNRYSLSGVGYISVFDYLQNIKITENKSLDYIDFNWPSDAEFIFTSFLISVYRENNLYATIEYNNEGRLVWISYFKENKIIKRLIIDDRGFVSSIEHYDAENLVYIEYLNKSGVWQFKYYIDKNYIEINPKEKRRFNNKTSFASIEDMISSELKKIYDIISLKNAKLIIAADDQHNRILIDSFPTSKKALSLFSNRYDIARESFLDEVKQVNLVVVDTESTYNLVVENLEKNNISTNNVIQLTPYDTRLELGLSQREKKSILYVMIDRLDNNSRSFLVEKMLNLSQNSDNIEILFITSDEKLAGDTEKIIELRNLDVDNKIDDEIDSTMGETIITKEEDKNIRVSIVKTEEDIILLLKKVRLVIDISNTPDLFTQIAAISSGIPQINRRKTPYVKHLKNGWILSTADEVEDAINYFTEELAKWNKALIYSIEQINYFNSEQLYMIWKEKLGE